MLEAANIPDLLGPKNPNSDSDKFGACEAPPKKTFGEKFKEFGKEALESFGLKQKEIQLQVATEQREFFVMENLGQLYRSHIDFYRQKLSDSSMKDLEKENLTQQIAVLESYELARQAVLTELTSIAELQKNLLAAGLLTPADIAVSEQPLIAERAKLLKNLAQYTPDVTALCRGSTEINRDKHTERGAVIQETLVSFLAKLVNVRRVNLQQAVKNYEASFRTIDAKTFAQNGELISHELGTLNADVLDVWTGSTAAFTNLQKFTKPGSAEERALGKNREILRNQQKSLTGQLREFVTDFDQSIAPSGFWDRVEDFQKNFVQPETRAAAEKVLPDWLPKDFANWMLEDLDRTKTVKQAFLNFDRTNFDKPP
jgi:hypothetical protein